MTKTFDMQFIRYMNLFNRVTRIGAKHCFTYNNTIVFVVPRAKVNEAIGKNNENLKKLSSILLKRIRIIAEPKSEKDVESFISVLISPIQYKTLEVVNNNGAEELIITAGMESKAMLIGRNKTRLEELKNIVEQYFGIKSVKIL
ncbi:NusA-like transcription termination signal-binding factor [Candidatus Pacearchaeota archaeon]|nr:NusA-like transcription termination signal-binding factor [Candidatus Pacearchaeota archaeon]